MSRERLLVSKFGGSSMANAESIGLVISIIEADPGRQVIVVSAPGRDENHADKVTDLLLRRQFGAFRDRFHQLGRDLGWQQRDQRIAEVMADIYEKPFVDYRASRGEYLSARMLVDLTGSEFVDAREVIHIGMDHNKNRTVNETSYDAIRQRVGEARGRVVLPGFYGIDKRRGWIRTLPRDGSDITGAAAARGAKAAVYEIFSDTAIMTADPRQNPDALPVNRMSYEELAALAESGAKIVHPQVAQILKGTGVSINCRNTFAPNHPGTWVAA